MKNAQYSAWNPGIESEIPVAYRELETIYRAENVTSSIDMVNEFAAYTGLRHDELVAFRPMRLALHELIVNEHMRVHQGRFKLVESSIFETKIKNDELAKIFFEIAPEVFPINQAPQSEIKA